VSDGSGDGWAALHRLSRRKLKEAPESRICLDRIVSGGDQHIDLVSGKSQRRLDVVKRGSTFRTEFSKRYSANEKSYVVAIPIWTRAIPAALGLR
jgi:hypothetical protein